MSQWAEIPGAGCWASDKWSKKGWYWRNMAVELDSGELLIYSPIVGMGDAAHQGLAALGKPTVLLAPNHFHYCGVREHLDRYPGCRLVATITAMPRLRAKTGLDFEPISGLGLARRTGGRVDVLEPPGLKSGESWLRVRGPDGVAWLISDAFFSLQATPTGLMGLICRLTGTTPGLRIGRTFTTLAVADRAAYRDWLLGAIEADRPTMLVPNHGEVVRGTDLPERLAALARARL